MFSLRQITVAGFLGVFPGCVLLAVNFLRLPYTRGALIGVAFACLMQFLLLLLYLLTFALISTALSDPTTHLLLTRVLIASVITLIQTLSAIGCRIMGTYFLYPEHDVTQYDRALLETRLRKLDTQKRSVVHDLVQSFKRTPPKKPLPQSWFHVAALALITLSVNALWLFNIHQAFYDLWSSGMIPQLPWKLSFAFNLLWPFLILVASGYACLLLNRTPKKHTPPRL